MAIESGVPVAWIPPPDVLQALVAATPSDRIAVLEHHTAAVVDACRARLSECTDLWVNDERTLIARALEAYEAGYHEAAMALAVAVGEPLAIWASEPRIKFFDSEAQRSAWEKLKKRRKYDLAEMELAAAGPPVNLKRLEILRHALIGPIPRFFTDYWGEPDEPIPETVSRHATVHRPTVHHLSRTNALLALMLCVSILREVQEWTTHVRQEEAFYDDDDVALAPEN